MFGHRYFGGRYFGARYFGPAVVGDGGGGSVPFWRTQLRRRPVPRVRAITGRPQPTFIRRR